MKTAGYFVYHENRPFPLGMDREGVLWFKRFPTLFQTRQSVRKAIRKTNAFEKKHGYPWTKIYGNMVVNKVNWELERW
jgi:hypothetical protein